MRKLIVSEFMSLDGVIQAPGGPEEDPDGGFTRGGWTLPYWHDDLGARFFAAMGTCDAFLLGRKTWQTHGEAFDPMPVGDPFGDMMNSKQKYVVSTTLTSADLWRNSTIINGDVANEVRRLKAMEGGDIYVDGSSVLVETLEREGLVDEYTILLYPIVLGGGKKLFTDGWGAKLKLVESTPVPSGVMILRYVPAD